MEDRVFNRSLFKKKTAARDKLREMGGIMASSEPLLAEAVRTITQPQQQMQPQMGQLAGLMALRRMQGQSAGMMPSMPQPMQASMPSMPSLPGMQQQPQMRPQPMAPMQQPMAQPQPAPAQQPQAQQPMQSPQMQPQQPMQQPQAPLNPMQQGQGRIGFQQGGRPEDVVGSAAGAVPRRFLTQGGVDVGQTAGTVVAPPDINAMSIADAYELGTAALSGAPVSIPSFSQEQFGDQAAELNDYSRRVVSSVADPNLSEEDRARLLTSAMGGNPRAENITEELASTANKTFDKEIDSNTKLDAMNRAIMGFAIASGTSPRATQNIANGMLVGLKAMRETEQQRIADAQARAVAAARGSSRNGTSVIDNMRRDVLRNISANPSNYGIDTYGSPQEFAAAVTNLTDLIMQRYTQDNAAPTATGGGTGMGGGTMSSIVNETPTTPKTVYRDLNTGEVMIVGEDGTPQPYEGG